MKMLQTMSLTGSVFLLFYFFLRLMGRNVFPYSFYKKCLMLSMVFFLFPLPYFIYHYMDLLERFFPLEEWGIKKYMFRFRYNEPVEHYIAYSKEGQFRINHPGFYFFSLICLGLLIVFGLWYFYSSRKFRNSVYRCSGKVSEDCAGQEYQELREKMKVRQNIQIRISSCIESPITTGVLKPVILLPQGSYNELGLVHELNHVKQRDMLFSVLSKIILALNFYNPSAWLLCYEWGRVVELACDEAVLNYAGDDKVVEYGELLIDAAEKGIFTRPEYAMGFSLRTQKNLLRERIKNMKNRRKMNAWKRAAAVVSVGCMAFVSSLTVFAYEPDVLWETEKLGEGEMEITYLTEEEFEERKKIHTIMLNDEKVTFQSKGYEQELIYLDKSGEVVVEEYKEPDAETKAACQHTFTNGIVSNHVKNSNGGCTTTYYRVVVCTKCNYVKSKTVSGTDTYVVCPH